jgi:hypothetical protein
VSLQKKLVFLQEKFVFCKKIAVLPADMKVFPNFSQELFFPRILKHPGPLRNRFWMQDMTFLYHDISV